ncbi:hypothetical protein [Spiroplasma cantharicola]|uniref:Transmembrane protein n=1 Tax=Spiroplasma cantharicola TaxID=362837 RepID=A0A0M4KEU2_9MOLU|nr:hypothetical protein [Spiroplasma cantharicola]ALD66570.1 hypothetical protein SCANT_v1c06640 [Spiroplasma cantharicola]
MSKYWISFYTKVIFCFIVVSIKSIIIISTGLNGAVNDNMHLSVKLITTVLLMLLWSLWVVVDILACVYSIKAESQKTSLSWNIIGIVFSSINFITAISVYCNDYTYDYLIFMIFSLGLIIMYSLSIYFEYDKKQIR